MPSSGLISRLFGRKRLLSRKSSYEIDEKRIRQPPLPDTLLQMIFAASSPFDLIQWRAVSKDVCRLIDIRFASVHQLEVRKADINTTLASAPGVWHRHPSAQVLMQLTDGKATLVVDEQWTTRDVSSVAEALHLFHRNVRSVQLDAPIVELVVVALSAMELNRWYAFLCYMKAFNSTELHLMYNWTKSKGVYFPMAENLTVRTTAEQSCHLARVVDYGVCSKHIIDRQKVKKLCVQLVDVKECKGLVSQHICTFRNWIGTIGFDSRYSQQCLGE
uniref:F-box domain-containing protein n=1 Tax=Plectus sambesii TaxID=2011161 RepID=A0A914W097_9BILA